MELTFNCCRVSVDGISIPVRYDWNSEAEGLPAIVMKFQFQLGTIGTRPRLAIPGYLFKFQFQLGTIGTPITFDRIWHLCISIPVRYDWNKVVRTHPVMILIISIPVRYDWN